MAAKLYVEICRLMHDLYSRVSVRQQSERREVRHE